MSTTIMRKLAPELLRGTELPQVEHIINVAFQFLTDQPKVMIRVASDLEPSLSGKINLLASRVGYEGQVLLIGEAFLEQFFTGILLAFRLFTGYLFFGF